MHHRWLRCSQSRRIVHKQVCKEVEADLDVWTYKTFVEQPPLSKSDGPVAVYRRDVKQFYPPIAGACDRQAVDEAAGQATS